jgi:DNA mismatch repair protein MutL
VRIGKEHEILAIIEEAVRECLRSEDLTPPVQESGAARTSPGTVPAPAHGPAAGIPADFAPVREPSPVSAKMTDMRLRQTELPTGISSVETLVPEMEVVGQIGGTYILARTRGDDLILIDQHAAHERVLYDQVTEKRDARRVSQELLVPVVIRESPREAALLRGITGLLGDRGFIVEEFGKESFLVRGIPSVLGRMDDASAIHDLLGDIFSE